MYVSKFQKLIMTMEEESPSGENNSTIGRPKVN